MEGTAARVAAQMCVCVISGTSATYERLSVL